jgi:hypothetical protein
MAKAIYNRLFQDGPEKLTNWLLAYNFKQAFNTNIENGTAECRKMKKERAAYISGIYAAFCQISETYITLKKQGHPELLHEFLSDKNCADYIIDRFAHIQVLTPFLYNQCLEEAEKDDNVIEV